MEDNIFIKQDTKKSLRAKILNKRNLVILLIVLIPIALVFYFFANKSSEQAGLPVDLNTTSKEQPDFELLFVEPKSGEIELAGTTNSITLKFDMPINLDSLVITSEPELQFNKTFLPHPIHGEIIVLQPKSPWVENETYKILILPGVKSIDGSHVYNKKIELEYMILPINAPIYDRPS